ncbi:MAG: TIGR02147 family protein [Bdellovibrionota bacterium]
MDAQEKLRQSLVSYFERIRKVDSAFSMRSLAKKINVPAGNLSQFLAGKRKFSAMTVESIARQITNNPEERKNLLEEINRQHVEVVKKSKKTSSDYEYAELSEEEFLALDEWYHYAVRTVLSLSHPKYEVKWLAEKLNITQVKAEKALKLLFKLKLIALSPDGKIVRTKKHLKTPDSIRKNAKLHAVKTKIHRQHIDHAMYSLENHDPSKRDITWVNIPANSSKLDQAREIIRKCQDDLLTLLEDESTDELYRLTIQLCPMGR